jgi:tripartite-type tricarboxylate transporter receptor subunit TctC
MRRRDFLAIGLVSIAAAPSKPNSAFAEGEYPQHVIRLIVPRSAGGVVDMVARLWAARVTPDLGNVVVEDQGGGGGLIAATAVAHARPDGYTLLAGTNTELINSPTISPDPPYNPVKDLVPITLMAAAVSAIMVHASLPVHSLQELVAYDKAHPGTLVYGSAGVGTMAHLCGELFKKLAGLPDIAHVPYRGGNEGLVDFYAGQLPMFSTAISPQALAMHRNGTIRILVAATDHHLQAAPDIPISTEVGFPDLIAVNFMGLFAPGGTPRPIIDKIATASRSVITAMSFQEKLSDDGFEPITGMGPEQAVNFIQQEVVRWTPILRSSGLQLN